MQTQEFIGRTQNETVQTKLIVHPFSSLPIISDFNKDFIADKELYIAYENVVSTKTTHFNKKIIEQKQTSTDGKAGIFTKSMLDEYLEEGAVHTKNKEFTYVYILEQELKQIYEQGFFNFSGVHSEKNTFNPPIVDDEKYCCVKLFRTCNRYFIQTEDNRFFTEAFHMNTYYTSSMFWNIEDLLENLIKNKQFLFFYEKVNSLVKIDTENPDELRKIITKTPHYNQNDECDQEEFICYYILNNDEVKAAMTDEKWAMKLYGHIETTLNENDRRHMFNSEELQILSFISGGLKHYHPYQSLIAEKYTKKINVDIPKKNKFR